jgi:hypothetical protein
MAAPTSRLVSPSVNQYFQARCSAVKTGEVELGIAISFMQFSLQYKLDYVKGFIFPHRQRYLPPRAFPDTLP